MQLLIQSLIVIIVIAFVQSQNQNVQDFHMATWNSDGARWNVVEYIMNTGIDVMAVQEAGTLQSNMQTPQINDPNAPSVCFVGGFDVTGGFYDEFEYEAGIREYFWPQVGTNNRFFVYFYDRSRDDSGASSGAAAKQNIAIISRVRANEVIVIPPEVIHQSTTMQAEEYQQRTFINRPILGIRINNAVFFTIHPEASRGRNEAPMLAQIIREYMSVNHPTRTWIVMGDFNRNPTQMPTLANIPNTFYQEITPQGVTYQQPGRNADTLDFAIVGGPLQAQRALVAIASSVISMTQMFFNRNLHGSDHHPVRFN